MSPTSREKFNPWLADRPGKPAKTDRPYLSAANRPNPAVYVILGKGTTVRTRGAVLASCRDGGEAFDLANEMPDARGYGAGDEGDARIFYVRGTYAEFAQAEAAGGDVAPDDADLEVLTARAGGRGHR